MTPFPLLKEPILLQMLQKLMEWRNLFPRKGKVGLPLVTQKSRFFEPASEDKDSTPRGQSREPINYKDARMGFVLASPELYLQGGHRYICIKLSFEKANFPLLKDVNVPKNGPSPFRIQFSGEEEWIDVHHIMGINNLIEDLLNKLKDPDPNTERIEFNLELKLDPNQPAVVPYNPEVLGENLSTRSPLVKVEFNPEYKLCFLPANVYPTCPLVKPIFSDSNDVPYDLSLYALFRQLKIKHLSIGVKVEGLKNIIVQSGRKSARCQ